MLSVDSAFLNLTVGVFKFSIALMDLYRLYTERRAASENCRIDNAHCIVFSF